MRLNDVDHTLYASAGIYCCVAQARNLGVFLYVQQLSLYCTWHHFFYTVAYSQVPGMWLCTDYTAGLLLSRFFCLFCGNIERTLRALAARRTEKNSIMVPGTAHRATRRSLLNA